MSHDEKALQHSLEEERSARLESDRALEIAEKRLQDVVDASGVYIWDVDLDWRYTYVSDRAEAILGLSLDRLVGMRLLDHVGESERARIGGLIANAANEKRAFRNVEFPTTTLLGETNWLTVNGVPVFDDRMQMIGFRGTGLNITHRKNAREALSKAKTEAEKLNSRLRIAYLKAEKASRIAHEANEAKGRFIANVSHELRTPLNGIIGYSNILSHTEGLPPEISSRVKIIHKSGEHLLTIINDILDLSKIDSNQKRLIDEPFILGRLLDQVVDMLRVRADENDNRLTLEHYDFEKNEPVADMRIHVEADQKVLRQIMLNLVGNAVKFTQSGKIVVRYGVICGSASESPEKVFRFEVEDTGAGISEENLDKLFGDFQQVEGNEKACQGSGLGLSISRRLARLMGSDIMVRSRLGAGTRFWFDVSLRQSSSEVARSNVVGNICGYEGVGKRILVVDDDGVIREILHFLLTSMDFEVILAKSTEEGLEIASQKRFDLAIVDLHLPDGSGQSLASGLKAQFADASRSIKVLAISSDSKQIIDMSEMDPFDGVLHKPIDKERLAAEIRNGLGLQWIYREQKSDSGDENSEGVRSDEFVFPDRSTLLRLLEYTQMGDIYALKKATGNLAGIDNRWDRFAKKVLSYINGFQLNRIERLIQERVRKT